MTSAGNRLAARRRRRVVPRLTRLFGGPRPRRRDRRGVDEPGKWRSRRLLRAVTALTGAVVLISILWLAWVAYLYFVRGGPSGLTADPDRRCAAFGFSCGLVSNVLASGLLVAQASSLVLWRLSGCSGATGPRHETSLVSSCRRLGQSLTRSWAGTNCARW